MPAPRLSGTVRLKPALSKGIPVEVTCDGPTEASSIALIESRKQREKWEDLHNHGIPGISNSDVLTFAEAGTQSLRVNILPPSGSSPRGRPPSGAARPRARR